MEWFIGLLDRPGASAGAILISATIALVGALFATITNRRTTKERETVVLINEFLWDKDFLDAKEIFVNVRDSNGGLEGCGADPASDEARAVGKIMNHYELLSVGFNTGILSGSVYAKFYRTRFVRDYEAAQAYIQTIRRTQENDKIFVEFEKRAKKWRRQMNGGLASWWP